MAALRDLAPNILLRVVSEKGAYRDAREEERRIIDYDKEDENENKNENENTLGLIKGIE